MYTHVFHEHGVNLCLYVHCDHTQVREQQRHIALQIRREVEQRRQRELEHLEEELRKDWERQQREKLHTLQRSYQESLQLLGQGHRSAKENVCGTLIDVTTCLSPDY